MASGTGQGYNYYPPSELQAYQASYAAGSQQTYSSAPNLHTSSYYDPTSSGVSGAGASGSNADPSFDANVAAQQSIYTPDAVQNPHIVQKANKGKARTTVIRKAGGETWEDQTLMEWDPSHFRLFVGDLAPEVSDDGLAAAFSKWPSFVKARVVRDKVTTKSKGYGFVSYKDPEDFMKAWKEMNGKYVGSRPIKISKATTKVGAVNIGSKKARLLETRKKKPIQGVERLRTGAGAVWKNDNRPYARR